MELEKTILFIFIGGVLPTLFWLYYWLREDSDQPEPKRLIFLTFILGMIAVPIAGILERFINILLTQNGNVNPTDLFFGSYTLGLTVLIVWSVIEEFLKYMAAHIGGLSHKDNNEPIDPVIYMITAALGFAACENMLYIFKEISHAGYAITNDVIVTGNFRFIGSTLLHTASSAIIGFFLSFSYYKPITVKYNAIFSGFVCSVTLHTLFNSFIIRQEVYTLIGFSIVWLAIVAIILLFEKVKKLNTTEHP